jgi:glycosyltransferase involved in cell wall biosynthesis
VFELAGDTGSDRHFFFCRYAAEKEGWQVTAITSNVDYKRAVARFPGRWFVRRSEDGVIVHYVYSFAGIRGSVVRRAWYYLTYIAATIIDALRQKRPDVVYAVSTPLTVGFLGVILSRIWRRPLVFEVTDLWPDALVAMGLMKPGPALSFARWMERTCYRNASAIVALTNGIREGIIGKGVDAGKVVLITNGFDPALFADVAPDARATFRNAVGVARNQLLCMYLGAHGIYNALGTVIGAAEALRESRDIVFVFVGDGDAKPRLERDVRQKNLTNVRFHAPIPRRESIGVLSAADVFLLPNHEGAFFRMNLPNKLFDFLASARPIVVAGEGETADVVTAAGAGAVVPAQDSLAMAHAIEQLQAAGERTRAEMGRRAQTYVREHYSREVLAESFMAITSRAAVAHHLP